MRYEWSYEKNEWLKNERDISFEEVIFHLSNRDLWRISDHPNSKKYPNQKIYFVNIDNYIYLVPCEIEDDIIYLKTIIPSRKATRDFQIEQEKEDQQ